MSQLYGNRKYIPMLGRNYTKALHRQNWLGHFSGCGNLQFSEVNRKFQENMGLEKESNKPITVQGSPAGEMMSDLNRKEYARD